MEFLHSSTTIKHFCYIGIDNAFILLTLNRILLTIIDTSNKSTSIRSHTL